MAEKYKINRVVDEQGTLAVVHPETEAEQVLYSNTIGGAAVNNVDEALDALKTLAQNSGVTGVKGNSETTYRTGNVNLTPADIGAVASNEPITAGTFTKVNVDTKGLVTGGSQATLDDIADGTTRKIPTDYIPISQKGENGGVATLGADGRVPNSQLPSYVDDVIEGYYYKPSTAITGSFYEDEAHTKLITPEAGKIYVDLNTHKTYRWGGISSGYVEISASLALGETSSTAYAGDKGKENASKISALEDVVYEILDNERNVGTANNALALGGVEASQYALKTDMPSSEFFVIDCYLNGTEVERFTETFNDIDYAMYNGKVPILFVYSREDDYREPTLFYFQYDGGDYFDFVRTTAEGVVESISIYSSNNDVGYGTVTLVNAVNDNGTGAIVSKIEKSGGEVNVTRRALQNSDLPNSGVTAGVYSAVQVNSKGVVTAGNQLIEWGTSGQTTPSASLAVGGLFFMKV